MLTAPYRPATRTGPDQPPDPGRARAGPRRLPGEGATTAALAVLTLASSFGLTRVFSGHSWMGPVVATIAVTHLVLWLMRRWRFPQAVAAPLSVLTVVLMVCWTVFGSTTVFGFPSGATWHQMGVAIRSIGPAFASSITPTPPIQGFELLAVAGAGAVAVLSDWIAFRWSSPMMAVLPGLATFIGCCTEAQGSGRGLVIAVEVAALCVFLLMQRASATGQQVWFAGIQDGALTWWMKAGALCGGLAILVGLIVTPSLSRQDGRAVYGWRSGFGPGSGVRVVPNPIVSLQTRLIQLSNTPVFSVQSTVPSYWRLTALDSFDGNNWKSTGKYQGFSSQLPGVASVPPGTRSVTESFHIQALDSVWLPDAFNPVSIYGIKGVEYDPTSNSLLTSKSTSNGLTYTVTSYQFLSTLDSQDLASAPPLGHQPGLAPYLVLPASVYGPITALALNITARRTTEYGKAIAIQNFLRSPPFTYSLHPTMDGAGQAALTNFLFSTHQGYCQQFAGAFAVLARAAGLPTRLAVGFTTGTPENNGTYQVADKDAHTWPEVYFGAKYGWLPFEPTPSFSEPGTSGYAAPGATSGSQSNATPTTLAPSTGNNNTPPINKNTRANTGSSTPSTTIPGVAPRAAVHSSWVPPVLGGLLGAIAVWVAANTAAPALRRRWRRRRVRQAGPAGVIRTMWDEVCSDLAWYGISRGSSETDEEFARRAGTHLAEDSGRGSLLQLARLAGAAAFGPGLNPAATGEAATAAAEVRHDLGRQTTWSDRLARLVVPRAIKSGIGWRRKTAGRQS